MSGGLRGGWMVLLAGILLCKSASAAPLQSVGNWETAQQVNALTDAKSFTFALTSTDQPLNMLGIGKPATLSILCSPDAKLFLGVDWPDFIQATELGSSYSSIAWRFDDRPMQAGRWMMYDTHDHVFIGGNDAGAMIAALSVSHRFVVGITGRQGEQTATFDLSGSDQLPALLASRCNIDFASPKITGSHFASPPAPVAQVGPEVSFASDKAPETVLAAAQMLLEAQGFSIAAAPQAGALTTQLAPHPITVAMADCGSLLGIPFVLDRRAHTQLQVIVRTAGGQVSISTAMWGLYQPGSGAKDRALVCKTKLSFEKALADQLKAAL